jgi:hypothetical protein
MTRDEIIANKENLQGADLQGADLRGADLRGANLYRANLLRANLCGADLRGANLYGADLLRANLCGADLYEVNLRGADLYDVNLREANLCGADLHRANLCGADLRGADLREADLRGANLCRAYLRDADLRGTKGLEETEIQPREGEIIGWKKCRNGVLVKVLVPKDAKRSNATVRKCRAERVMVLEVIGAMVGTSKYDPHVLYEVGKIVQCDKWEEDRWIECGGGIHYFITREEAEGYE